jgi:23S rRNA pseudouridine1911/1915/1917 synthase
MPVTRSNETDDQAAPGIDGEVAAAAIDAGPAAPGTADEVAPGIDGGPVGAEIEGEVPAALDGLRLDRVVALLTGLSRAEVGRLVDEGAVTLDGRVERLRRRSVRAGQRLAAAVPAGHRGPLADPTVPVVVVYEDDHVVVVDKPAGLVVHHGAGRRGGTLVDGLLARYPELADLPHRDAEAAARPGIVHRLDKDTSGLLVVARSPLALRALAAQFTHHRASRRYVALVDGSPDAASGVVDAPVGRSARQPTKMAVVAGGRDARTHYDVLRRSEHPLAVTLVRLDLETGRTHQIRVHMAAIGHPVVGDTRYASPATVARHRTVLGVHRQQLHAAELRIVHPTQGPMAWTSDIPADMRATMDRLGIS